MISALTHSSNSSTHSHQQVHETHYPLLTTPHPPPTYSLLLTTHYSLPLTLHTHCYSLLTTHPHLRIYRGGKLVQREGSVRSIQVRRVTAANDGGSPLDVAAEESADIVQKKIKQAADRKKEIGLIDKLAKMSQDDAMKK